MSSQSLARAVVLFYMCANVAACKGGDGDGSTDNTAGAGGRVATNEGGANAGGGPENSGSGGVIGGPAGKGGTGAIIVDAGAPDTRMGQGGMPADSNANCIMPLGDSITQGDLEHLSYRYWLWKQLTDAGNTFGFVGSMRARMARMAGQTSLPYPDAKFDIDHQGHWGKTPKEILDILNAIANWDRITPGIVLMHAGTNEVWTAGNESADAIAQRAVADIGRIVDLLRTKNPGVKIFMARIIPLDVAKYGTPYQNAINAINTRVATLATTKNTTGSPIVVVDQWTGFAATDFQADGVHPNESGEKKLATRWFNVLDPLLRAAGSAPCPY